ncbi:uncharacterized protein LOC106142978 [Amyelois transitella]|uniref:uncharacterized protein LOC106142978 n=1 Tax=Amyelois transitella TaxID=680683 RepID=UPI00067E4B31|nr:uncharacterized protein LOC106142978 [Amyelois transitella]
MNIMKHNNSMINNRSLQGNLRLLYRSEAKIKCYESSVDLRSWSHDAWRRSRYLQEWMKSNVPIRVIPGQTLAFILNTMTCRSRRKVAPKCHPDCKSKLVLDSICNSCGAMQECLKNDSAFGSYFQEEEFETCYWPCERCLEVLKNIKMFWKIFVEKVFNVKIPKSADYKDSSLKIHRADTVHSVAKMWEKEIIEQAMFVNKIVPILKRKSESKPMDVLSLQKESQTGDFITLHKSLPKTLPDKKKSSGRKKITRSTSVKVKMVNQETNTSNIENEEIKIYKHNVEYLQKKFNRQESEIENLRRENNSLKIELENFYENCSWQVPFNTPAKTKIDHIIIDSSTTIPTPFECCVEDISKENVSKGIDSEMIITMRNCKNEKFKHVSFLQVLHKTNGPIDILDNIRSSVHIKENPIDLLTKVRNTFGELVRREMDVVNKAKDPINASEITASFIRVNVSKSEPSCTAVGYCSKVNASSSESPFASL